MKARGFVERRAWSSAPACPRARWHADPGRVAQPRRAGACSSAGQDPAAWDEHAGEEAAPRPAAGTSSSRSAAGPGIPVHVRADRGRGGPQRHQQALAHASSRLDRRRAQLRATEAGGMSATSRRSGPGGRAHRGDRALGGARVVVLLVGGLLIAAAAPRRRALSGSIRAAARSPRDAVGSRSRARPRARGRATRRWCSPRSPPAVAGGGSPRCVGWWLRRGGRAAVSTARPRRWGAAAIRRRSSAAARAESAKRLGVEHARADDRARR